MAFLKTILFWFLEWLASWLARLAKKQAAIQEEIDKGSLKNKEIIDNLKQAKTKEEQESATKDLADNSF